MQQARGRKRERERNKQGKEQYLPMMTIVQREREGENESLILRLIFFLARGRRPASVIVLRDQGKCAMPWYLIGSAEMNFVSLGFTVKRRFFSTVGHYCENHERLAWKSHSISPCEIDDQQFQFSRYRTSAHEYRQYTATRNVLAVDRQQPSAPREDSWTGRVIDSTSLDSKALFR